MMCSKCKGPREKPEDYYCKKCRAEYVLARYHGLQDGTWKARERYPQIRIVGTKTGFVTVTPKGDVFFIANQERLDLIEAAGDKCQICGRTDPEVALQIDHCHTQYRFRGVLCMACNTGIGLFRDNPEWLQAAITYLKN